jgi:hypothetical protein
MRVDKGVETIGTRPPTPSFVRRGSFGQNAWHTHLIATPIRELFRGSNRATP